MSFALTREFNAFKQYLGTKIASYNDLLPKISTCIQQVIVDAAKASLLEAKDPIKCGIFEKWCANKHTFQARISSADLLRDQIKLAQINSLILTTYSSSIRRKCLEDTVDPQDVAEERSPMELFNELEEMFNEYKAIHETIRFRLERLTLNIENFRKYTT